jgi:hypothetical protein
MWSLLPLAHILRKRLGRMSPDALESAATRSWEIAPAERSITKPAYFLAGQLERVTGWEFASEHPRREMEGGLERVHVPTRGFLLKDAWLIDGVLYKGTACSHLRPRSSLLPFARVQDEIGSAAVFGTAAGNRYFGQWLMDDCVTYPLACAEGAPVTTDGALPVHTPGYERWLGMTPTRVRAALLRNAVIFDDVGQNRSKHARFRAMGDKLLSRVPARSHPGVFIVRGCTGQRRMLANEAEIGEYLRVRRGFRVLDPAKADVPTIVDTCAGARVVVGVEGSGLMHGIIVLPRGGAVLTLQPPNRFVGVYKHLTDRDDQHFGFVVGKPDGEDFRIDPIELERTLDLFPA